jgi:hypothetical protein
MNDFADRTLTDMSGTFKTPERLIFRCECGWSGKTPDFVDVKVPLRNRQIMSWNAHCPECGADIS